MFLKKIIFSIVFFLLLIPLFSHASAYNPSKKIIINLEEQKLYALEDKETVFETAVSSGLPLTPTVRGAFSIYSKLPSQTMQGGSPLYGEYYLPNVPNVMYFYQAYAIHGAYWHNNFGRPASHGCVNLPLASANYLYQWASIGTNVEIY